MRQCYTSANSGAHKAPNIMPMQVQGVLAVLQIVPYAFAITFAYGFASTSFAHVTHAVVSNTSLATDAIMANAHSC